MAVMAIVWFLVGAVVGVAAGLWMHRTGERDCSDWRIK